MSIAWISPVALAGLALIALPIAIHLLVRQQTRVLAYPSLRFLRETALAAFRGRAIQDAALLACRAAAIAAAVMALAGPVLQTSSRTSGYASRVSRAVVMVDEGVPGDEPGEAFRTATFTRAVLADAIADAVRWLDAQPPSSREIVFTGSFRRGAIGPGDLLAVPGEIGVRLIAGAPLPAPGQITAPFLTRRNGSLARIDQVVRADADTTRIDQGPATPIQADRVRVVAATREQSLAEAALRAAIDEGVPWTAGDRRVLVVWEGAAVESPPPAGVEVIRMPVPNPPASAASATWNAIARATPGSFVDPVLIPREQLVLWSRPSGPPSPLAKPVDEGDRRWLWAAALALIALEYVLRRDRPQPRSIAAEQEARIA